MRTKINYDGSITYITKRIRNNKGVKGFLVAVKKENENSYNIGFSLCNRVDEFDKDFGLALAINRALRTDRNPIIVPLSIRKSFHKFSTRAQKYFKGCVKNNNRIDDYSFEDLLAMEEC